MTSLNVPSFIIDLYFPEDSHRFWVEYLEGLSEVPNPYTSYLVHRQTMASIFLDCLKVSSATEDASILQEIIEQKKQGGSIPVIVIHNFPMERQNYIRPTPKSYIDCQTREDNTPDRRIWISEWSMIAWNTLIGHDLVHKQSMQHGLLTTHVCPFVGMEAQVNHGGMLEVPLHTEASYLPSGSALDGLTLLALHNSATPTTFVLLDEYCIELHSELTERFYWLSKPWFCFYLVDPQGREQHHLSAPITERLPDGSIARWRIQTNMRKIRPAPHLSDVHQRQVQQLIEQCTEIINRFKIELCLKYGDLVCFDNRLGVAHGRGHFHSIDGSDCQPKRYLLRQQSRYNPSILTS